MCASFPARPGPSETLTAGHLGLLLHPLPCPPNMQHHRSTQAWRCLDPDLPSVVGSFPGRSLGLHVHSTGMWYLAEIQGGGNQGCRGQAEGAAHKVGMVLSRGSYWWWRIIGSDVSHVTLLSEWDPQHPGAGLPQRPVVSSAWPCGTGAGLGTHRFLWLQAQWSLRFRVETRDQKCKTCGAQEADGIWGPRDHK